MTTDNTSIDMPINTPKPRRFSRSNDLNKTQRFTPARFTKSTRFSDTINVIPCSKESEIRTTPCSKESEIRTTPCSKESPIETTSCCLQSAKPLNLTFDDKATNYTGPYDSIQINIPVNTPIYSMKLIKGGMKIKEPIHFPRNNDSDTSVFIPDTDNSIIDCFSNNTSDSLNIPNKSAFAKPRSFARRKSTLL